MWCCSRLSVRPLVCRVVWSVDQVDGYIGRFEVRDAGVYALQVIIGAYFGATDPKLLPVPIPAGTHTGGCSECNIRRAMIDSARLIAVTLKPDSVPSNAQLFGTGKCTGGDHLGRWIDLDPVGIVCKRPYCTGPSQSTIHQVDWVRQCLLVALIALCCFVRRRHP
jgi:hypothetical protein